MIPRLSSKKKKDKKGLNDDDFYKEVEQLLQKQFNTTDIKLNKSTTTPKKNKSATINSDDED